MIRRVGRDGGDFSKGLQQTGESGGNLAPELSREQAFVAGKAVKARNPGADDAVAAPEMVIKECERGIRRDRLKPQRELGQLDGHGIEIHAVKAVFSHAALPVGDRRIHRP